MPSSIVKKALSDFNGAKVYISSMAKYIGFSNKELSILSRFWKPAFDGGWILLSNELVLGKLTKQLRPSAMSNFHKKLRNYYIEDTDYRQLSKNDELVKQWISDNNKDCTKLGGKHYKPWFNPRRAVSSISDKIQIILRAFPSPSSILHGFDVASSYVLYTGKKTWMTKLALYVFKFRVNLVNPEYRSTRYEKRLAKYFHRGFAIAFPHLKPGLTVSGKSLKLPHIKILVDKTVGNLIIGNIEVGNTPLSDYDFRIFLVLIYQWNQ
jgi:hypothetical protein